jgi:hypothetical protein
MTFRACDLWPNLDAGHVSHRVRWSLVTGPKGTLDIIIYKAWCCGSCFERMHTLPLFTVLLYSTYVPLALVVSSYSPESSLGSSFRRYMPITQRLPSAYFINAVGLRRISVLGSRVAATLRSPRESRLSKFSILSFRIYQAPAFTAPVYIQLSHISNYNV